MKPSPKFAVRRFPRGAYWICDPCYAYPEGEWQSFCDVYFKHGSGVHEYGDESFFMWSTAYGDGHYPVYGPKSGGVSVDSGTLAIIPVSLVEKWGATEELKRLEAMGNAISIRTARNFTVNEEECNVFFLDYCVDTSGFTCEDDDDDEEGGDGDE